MTEFDPAKLLKQWGGSVVPVESSDRVTARRADVVPHIALAMRRGARGRRRRSRVIVGWFGFAAAVLLAAGFVLFARFASEQTPDAVATPSPVRVESGELSQGVAGLGRAVHAGQDVVVGQRLLARVPSSLSVAKVTGLRLERDSELLISKVAQKQQLMRLSRGRMSVDVLPGRGMDVRIQTPDAHVTVKGTRFTVAIVLDEGATTTSVAVQRGSVEVRGAEGRRHLLSAGERWSSRAARKAVRATPALVAAPEEAFVERSSRVPPRSVRSAAPRAEAQRDTGTTLAEENALFHEALRSRNQGEDARAVQLFTTLLSQYPRTTLSQEAKVERFRALGRLGKSQQAAESARRYLAEHPGGFAQAEAREFAWQDERRRGTAQPPAAQRIAH
ncbi:MAG TPA: FecR domain-containing protein [Polyangiaceae bacterium]